MPIRLDTESIPRPMFHLILMYIKYHGEVNREYSIWTGLLVAEAPKIPKADVGVFLKASQT